MVGILVFVHVIVALLLIGAILLHSGRGTGLSTAFGGGLPAAMTGSTMIEKNLDRITIVLAVVFGVTSIALARLT